ncbi:MAG: hypothetical protein WC315_08355 [Candidatus Omnitrophota bacterium]|jgi:hypothetical protein
MENLTFISQDEFCRYYKTPNHFEAVEKLVLKEYISGDGIAMRALTVFSKSLVRKELRNNIAESFQGRIVALSEITDEDRMVHLGRVLFVRRVDKIPISCILSGDDCIFQTDKTLKFHEAVSVLKNWLSLHKQYKMNPAHFLLNATERTLSAAEIINNYFKSSNLNLRYFEIGLGMEIDEESKEIVPVWVGEGITPQTASIFKGGKLIKDSKYLAERIFPPSVYKKEIEELS